MATLSSLLGPGTAVASTFSGLGTNTSTPATAIAPAKPATPAVPSLAALAAGTKSATALPGANPMGNTSVSTPAIPALSQVDTSSFTPGQLAAFNAAKALIPGSNASNASLVTNALGLGAPATPPATPAVPTVAAPLSAGNVTGASGTVVNPNTGAAVPVPALPATAPTTTPVASTSPAVPATTPTSVYGTSTSGLSALGATNPANTGAGVAGYDTAVENLANFEAGLQGELGATAKQSIPLPFIQGQQQVENTENAGILSALQGAVTSAQGGVQLGISGYNAQEGALSSAAGLTAPQSGAAFFGSPETGSLVGGGSAAMASAVALQAQKIANGTTDPASALAALSAYGQPAVDALQQALGPSFNLNQAEGSAAAQATNATTAGTATPSAENTIYQSALSDYSDLTQYTSNVSGLGSLLTSGMTSASGVPINPTDSQYANMTIAAFRQQLSSPSQAQFDSTLAALQSKVSGMLSIGGSETPTQLTSDANSIINGTAPVGTLNATLTRIQDEGDTLLTNQAAKVNTAKANIASPSTNLGTSGSSSSSGWDSITY